jgi:hypothetical protein
MNFPSPYTDITFSKTPKYNIKDEVTFFHESWFSAKVLSGKIIGISRKIATGNIGYLVICPEKQNVISIDEDRII